MKYIINKIVFILRYGIINYKILIGGIYTVEKMQDKHNLLKRWEILGYGMGGFSSTLPNQFKTQFGMSFMTDIAGVSGGVVGILSMITTIWDAINDPIVGDIVDKTNTKRFGRYRPHMLIGVILMAITLVMMFCVPNVSAIGKIVYYCITMALFSVFFTQFTVPWQALNSIMSTNPHQRNLLLVSRQLVGAVATSMVGLLTLPIVTRFTDEKAGWMFSALIVGIIMIISALCAIASAGKQDVYQEDVPEADKQGFLKKLQMLKGNKAVVFASLLLGTVNFAITINAGISMYYFRCVVGNRKLIAVVSGIQILVSLLFVPFLPRLLRRWGKIPVLRVSMVLQAISAVLLMILRENASVPMVIFISLLTTTGLTFSNICCFALLPDCTDYTELHFGSSQAGFVNAISTFVRKLCGSFSYLIIGGLLELVGYSSELPIEQSWITMIVDVKVFIPITTFALVLVFSYFYPINSRAAKELREILHHD